MARKALYDLQEVTELATELFWEKGYAGTAMEELINYSGFNRRSMYAEFGNKYGFFNHVLTQYIELKLQPISKALLDNRGQVSIDAYFYKLTRFLFKKGCLLTNAVCELSPGDTEIQSLADQYYANLQSQFEDCLNKAIEQKQIKGNISTEAFALQLTALTQGLSVMAKISDSRDQLDIAVEAVLKPVKL